MRKNIEFIKVNFYLLIKKLTEYKSNLYSSLIAESFYYTTMIFFFMILYNNFGNVISWSRLDFVLYFLINSFIFSINGIFLWKMELWYYIKEGILNNFLSRPINTFIFFTFYSMSVPALVMSFFSLISITLLVLIFKVKLYNLFLSCLVILLVSFFNFSTYNFFQSLDFIKLKLSDLVIFPYNYINATLEDYPAPFWEKYNFKFLLLGFSSFISSFIILPLIRNYNVENLYLKLFVIFVLSCVFFVLTLLNWRRGLKKYEAFS